MSSLNFDNAATSFPKPEAVYAAVDQYNRMNGAPVGRSTSGRAAELERTVSVCRGRLAEFFRAESASRIAFTFNGTDSLNLAIHGLLRPGDHVVSSVIEHNSIIRPLRFQQDRGVTVSWVQPGSDGLLKPADVMAAIRPETRLVALTHGSNVTGAIQPIPDIGLALRPTGVPLLVDAAQTAGHIPIDVVDWGIGVLACSGHKGLLGPLGTGVLYVSPILDKQLIPIRQGGTGGRSEDDSQPGSMPEKLECGNHNSPGLVGLAAACDWLRTQSIAELRRQELMVIELLLSELQGVSGVRVHHSAALADSLPIVSVSFGDGLAPHDMATILDQNFGIQTRAGLHCAPRMHGWLGTLPAGGTLRLSPGRWTTSADISQVTTAIRDVAASMLG